MELGRKIPPSGAQGQTLGATPRCTPAYKICTHNDETTIYYDTSYVNKFTCDTTQKGYYVQRSCGMSSINGKAPFLYNLQNLKKPCLRAEAKNTKRV